MKLHMSVVAVLVGPLLTEMQPATTYAAGLSDLIEIERRCSLWGRSRQ